MSLAMPLSEATQAAPDLARILGRQREAFLQVGPPEHASRVQALDKLQRMIVKFRDDIVRVVNEDFGNRSAHETMLAEVLTSLDTVRHARKHLKGWMKPQRRPMDRTKFTFARGRVHYQPLGVVGIIAPWNYPVYLALSPLVAALAAGNRVMLKPSELTPRTSALLQRMIAETFDPSEVAVVTGGPELGEAFSRLPLDHLLFTGSTSIGRRVMQAAAENLTPVTLELGGKSPAIIASDYPLDQAVQSIMSGKLLNAGQTCIAPDYVFVPRARQQDFVAKAKEVTAKLYPTVAGNPDYTAIVSDRHYQRLQRLSDEARHAGVKVIELDHNDQALSNQRKIAPTLLLDPGDELSVMREEIFGPLLPVKAYDDISETIDYVNRHPRPLALYLFSNDSHTVDRVLSRTTSGGVTVNDTLYHVAAEDLPFGGVGPSGIGAYHGWEGFRTFSHAKGTFYQSRHNLGGMLRPPYGPRMDKLLRFMLKRSL